MVAACAAGTKAVVASVAAAAVRMRREVHSENPFWCMRPARYGGDPPLDQSDMCLAHRFLGAGALEAPGAAQRLLRRGL